METAQAEGGALSLLVLVLIAAVGIAGMILFRRSVGPVLPSRLRAGGPLEGTVLEKLLTVDWLLLTVQTEAGVLLATFTDMLAEIDRLVAPGDVITLDVRGYRHTVEDPRILEVKRPASIGANEPARAAGGEEHRGPGRPGRALPPRAGSQAAA